MFVHVWVICWVIVWEQKNPLSIDMGKYLHIGRRLVSEREKTGMSQTSFGAAGGVTRKTQYNYEEGIRAPDVAYLEAIGKIEGVDIGFIVTGVRSYSLEEPKPQYDFLRPDQKALLDNFEHCSEEDKRAIRRLALLASKEADTETESPARSA